MGAFRDFFKGLFGGIKEIPEKISELIVKMDFIVIFLSTLKEDIEDIPEKIKSYWFESKKWFYVQTIKQFDSVSKLEKGFKTIPSDIREDAEIIVIYEDHKEKLTAEGYLTPVDRVLNPVAKGIKGGVKLVTDAALENLTPVFEDFMKAENIPEHERAQIRKIASSGEFGLNAVVGFMLGHFLSPILSTSLAPAWEGMGQIAWKTLPVRLAEPNILVRLKYKGLITESFYIEQLRKQGIGEEVQKLYEEDFLFYPNPHDLVTWQAREVYEPNMIKKYGLEDELENVLKDPFYKAGMNDEQIRNFWIAHWTHPPWTVIRNMLFRTDLTEEDVWDWFKTIEIPPFWRDKYIEIAYNPVGRVDLRRLYKEGIYDREEVKAGYIALGNSPEISEHLTAWTEKAYAPDSKELTKTEILKNYRIEEIGKDKATEMLTSLDYDAEEVEFILAYEDYKIAHKEKEDEAELLLVEILNGTITYEAFKGSIEGLGFNVKVTNRYLNKATKTLRAQIKLPSKEDLTKWFSKGIISEAEFVTMMSGLKYRSEDINRYLEELKSKT